MTDDDTHRLVKPGSKVSTDKRGRTVWTKPIEPTELELVSTVMLQKILSSDDESSKAAIEDAARCDGDGVLAHDPGNGGFAIIDDDELAEILKATGDSVPVHRPADINLVPLKDGDAEAAEALSLVSTQALRKVLGSDDKQEAAEDTAAEPAAAATGGFDPYNSR